MDEGERGRPRVSLAAPQRAQAATLVVHQCLQAYQTRSSASLSLLQLPGLNKTPRKVQVLLPKRIHLANERCQDLRKQRPPAEMASHR